jgi:hypothetical protein
MDQEAKLHLSLTLLAGRSSDLHIRDPNPGSANPSFDPPSSQRGILAAPGEARDSLTSRTLTSSAEPRAPVAARAAAGQASLPLELTHSPIAPYPSDTLRVEKLQN